MNKKYFILIITLFISSILLCQFNTDCNKIKKGTFYFYPSNSNRKFIIERTDTTQKEIDINNKDTTLWKITWQKNYFYYLQFLSKTNQISEEERSFYNLHSPVIRINNIYKDYYTFSGGLDSLNNIGKIQDTVWLHQKEIKNSN